MDTGSPFAPHSASETADMLATLGVEDVEELFDIPDDVRFSGTFGLDHHDEYTVRTELDRLFRQNVPLIEFLGRGHYDHYVPSLVDHLSDRSEFLTSYTQYQPEIAQGFLQALFEYQSMLVELTGLEVANCSIYDAATALGEAARLSARAREITGTQILIPERINHGRRSTLENYVAGTELSLVSYPYEDANVDIDDLSDRVDDDVAMVYVESPTVLGTLEENLERIGDLTDIADALFVLGTDPVALAIIEQPASVGVDVVIGDAATLGLGSSHGMGLGMFATREEFLRQVPGRIVGLSTDEVDRRSFTLTLQTREQHIRRERATSNICTNQAWVALRTAIHVASLGPDGLIDLATVCLERPRELAQRLDEIVGVIAPVYDRHHFREFVAHTDQPAKAVAADLEQDGYAVHVIGEHQIQVCVTETTVPHLDGFVSAFREAAR